METENKITKLVMLIIILSMCDTFIAQVCVNEVLTPTTMSVYAIDEIFPLKK